MKVLSLCDGMSCGQIALKKLNIPVEAYYASEIKDIAIKVTLDNFPNTIEIGNVNKVHYSNGILSTEKGDFNVGKIDLVMFGSPCQTFSIAMAKKIEQAQRIKKNPDYFLNVIEYFRKYSPPTF